ncbi:MAG: TPM domain-containing protein [Paracoccaceae bacterium]
MRSLLLWFLLWPGLLWAQSFPDYSDIYVNDFADVLDDSAEARIADILRAGAEETGVTISVATIRSRADYGDTDTVEDFAKGLFNAWGIGDAERNDGVLILVATEDREARIALGAGFSPVYDGRAQRVIDSAMLPEFRAGRYPAGIEAGALSAVERLARPFAARAEVTETSGFDTPRRTPWGLIVAGLGAAAVAARIFWSRSAWSRRCPDCGRRGVDETRDIVTPAGTNTPGRMILHRRCRHCDTVRDSERPIPARSSRRSGGGGGSFGGGRSSGGGATGRW